MKPMIKSSLVLIFILAALILMPAQSTWAGQKAQTLPTAPPPGLTTPAQALPTLNPEKLARWCKYLQENPYWGMGSNRPYSWWRLSRLKLACQAMYPNMEFDY